MNKMCDPVFRTIHAGDIAPMACATLCREAKFPLRKTDVLYGGTHKPEVHRLARRRLIATCISIRAPSNRGGGPRGVVSE